MHWAARCAEPEKRETLEELLASKGADKHAKDNVMDISKSFNLIRANILSRMETSPSFI